MEIGKKETVLAVSIIDKSYKALSDKSFKYSNFAKTLPVVANICIKLHPLFNDNPCFMRLFDYVNRLLSKIISLKNENAPGSTAIEEIKSERNKLLVLLEQFELSLLDNARFNINLYNCKSADIPLNYEYAKSVTEQSVLAQTPDSLPAQQNSAQEFSVLIYLSQLKNQKMPNADFFFQTEDIKNTLDTMASELKSIDYYTHDRLYLEAKLNSLKSRQDIRLLLAGSSYTMCGLFEDEMPIPARNVAIDAQDLYYTLKTVRTALEYNKNITHCIISFAYYFWGYDLSLSTSVYQYKRITEVNYPVFKDWHNFQSSPDAEAQNLLTSVTPLEKRIFSYEMLTEQYIKTLKNIFTDSHYFPYPRVESKVLALDDATNRENAQKRAASHNKFFKYNSTVEENRKLFADFLEDMNHLGVKILLYVPPVTSYYRNSINKQLISDFYVCMKPFQEKYDFKLVDLFNSDAFKNGDFADYDHLNDHGAKKLGKILTKEFGL